MLSAKYILWSKAVSVDSQTNSLSVFEVIEELNTTHLPFVMPETKLVCMFERNAEKDLFVFDCRLHVKSAGKTVGEQNFTLDFKGLKRNRLVIVVPAFKIEHAGKLSFTFFHKNKSLAEYHVNVLRVE